MQKNLLLFEKLKNIESAQLCSFKIFLMARLSILSVSQWVLCLVRSVQCWKNQNQSWALPVFLNFLHFFQVNHLLLHQSYLKSPLPVKLTW